MDGLVYRAFVLLLQDESRADLLRPALVELALQLARQP